MIIPKLIMLCGIPGSGKSTYANDYVKHNDNVIHLSSDAIRAELLSKGIVLEDTREGVKWKMA